MFTITAETNLPVGSEVVVKVFDSALTNGATGTVKITKGDSGMNKISFDVDASAFKSGQYNVFMNSPFSSTTGTTQFNILGTTGTTVIPTKIVTTSSQKGIIIINSIDDKHVGDKFTITGVTTLPVDTTLYVMILPSSQNPTQDSGNSGASGSIKPISGTLLNSWSFDVDATTFKPGKYDVEVFDMIMHSATDSETFNIIAQSQTPTTIPTESTKTFINIDPVGDKHVGDKFTITALTNLPEGSKVIVKIYSSSTTGATGVVNVIKSTNGMNKVAFDVDSSAFKSNEYVVDMSDVSQTASGNIKFNILDNTASTPNITTSATKSVNQLLEEQNKKIDEQNKLIEEQNKKLAEQSGILDQILNYFKGIFGVKS